MPESACRLNNGTHFLYADTFSVLPLCLAGVLRALSLIDISAPVKQSTYAIATHYGNEREYGGDAERLLVRSWYRIQPRNPLPSEYGNHKTDAGINQRLNE